MLFTSFRFLGCSSQIDADPLQCSSCSHALDSRATCTGSYDAKRPESLEVGFIPSVASTLKRRIDVEGYEIGRSYPGGDAV